MFSPPQNDMEINIWGEQLKNYSGEKVINAIKNIIAQNDITRLAQIKDTPIIAIKVITDNYITKEQEEAKKLKASERVTPLRDPIASDLENNVDCIVFERCDNYQWLYELCSYNGEDYYIDIETKKRKHYARKVQRMVKHSWWQELPPTTFENGKPIFATIKTEDALKLGMSYQQYYKREEFKEK